MDLREVLTRLKSENGLTTELLSERSGVPKGTLNKLLNGETRNPTGSTLKKIADALRCPVETLYPSPSAQTAYLHEENRHPAYDASLGAAADLMPVTTHNIPLLGEIAAGKPIYADEAHERVLCADMLKCDCALRVRGDSMTGARINDGDLVFLQLQDDVEDGEIAAVLINDEATLKRIYHVKNGLQLLSENPKYPPMLFTAGDCDSIRILGKAVGFQSKL